MYNIKSAEPTINNNQFEYWKGNSMKILNLQLFSKRYFIPIEFYTHYLFFFMKYIMESIIWKELAWELRNVVPIISLLLSTCVIIGNWPKAIYSFKTCGSEHCHQTHFWRLTILINMRTSIMDFSHGRCLVHWSCLLFWIFY